MRKNEFGSMWIPEKADTDTVKVVTSLSGRMEYPNYTDKRFARGRMVYQAKNCPVNLTWDYSDHFPMWDSKQYKKAHNAAQKVSGSKSHDPKWHKTFLETYYPGAILYAIQACYNVSSGHPIWVYGYVPAKGENDDATE